MPSIARCPRCGYAPGYSVAAAAAELGVSEQAVRSWLKRGRFPGAMREAVPGGYRWWIPRTDFARFRRAREARQQRRLAA